MAAAVTPGYGFDDSIEKGLVPIERAIDAQPASPLAKVLKPDCLEVVYAARACKDGLWGLRDEVEAAAELMGEMKRAAVMRAVEAMPTQGYGLGSSYESARDSAGARAAGTVVDDVTGGVVAKSQKKGAKFAKRFSDAAIKLQSDIEEARLEADSPQGATLEDIAMIAAWETRARSQKQPCAWLLSKVDGYVAAEKWDRLRTCLLAADTIVLEQLSAKGKVQQSATHYGGRMYDSTGGGPMMQALALQSRLKQVRLQMEDTWIQFADGVLDRMRPIFTQLVGSGPQWMTAGERARLYYDVDGASKGNASPWEPVAPSAWMSRWLPSSGAPDTSPSGWSKILTMGNDGVPIRAPAPGSRR